MSLPFQEARTLADAARAPAAFERMPSTDIASVARVRRPEGVAIGIRGQAGGLACQ